VSVLTNGLSNSGVQCAAYKSASVDTISQSRPEYGLGFQVKPFKILKVLPFRSSSSLLLSSLELSDTKVYEPSIRALFDAQRSAMCCFSSHQVCECDHNQPEYGFQVKQFKIPKVLPFRSAEEHNVLRF